MTTEQLPGRSLADRTTLRVGGPAKRLVVAVTEQELIAAVREADRSGEPVLVLGGGSNVLIGDDGFDGTVVAVATRGITAEVSDCSGAVVRLAAGEPWEAFVASAVQHQWSGVEALAGIPGLVGATPIQNVGAYGAEVSQTIASVQTWDRLNDCRTTFAVADCGFAYRSSRFKEEPGRFVVLSVTFQLRLGELSQPVRYVELARELGVELGERIAAEQVRQAVLSLRRRKGMVLEADDHDTWSAGSFFTNPVLTAEQAARLPEDAPRYLQPDSQVKTSAAWLIEHAGFGRGYGHGPAALSGKHALALTNRGTARAADLLALARELREGVADTYGIRLIPEPVLINCSLD